MAHAILGTPLDPIGGLQAKMLCAMVSPTATCDVKSLPYFLRTKVTACESIVKTKFCQELEKAQPEFYGRLRRCRPDQFCEDYIYEAPLSVTSCLKGILEGTGENVSKALDYTEFVKKNVNSSQNIFLNCDSTTLACRRALTRNLPRFKKISDDDLAKYSWAALLNERSNYENAMAAYRRNSASSSFLSQRVENTPQDSNFENPQVSMDFAIVVATADWLAKKFSTLQCLDTVTQREMLCWGIAQLVLDPIVVMKAAKLKGPIARLVVGFKEKALGKEITEDVISAERRQAIPPDRRNLDLATAKASQIGIREVDIPIPGAPSSVKVSQYKTRDGAPYLMYEKTVYHNGKPHKLSRELPQDSLTGAIDANYEAGRDLLATLLKENPKDLGLVFIDVNNLGHLNRNFSKLHTAGDEYLKNVAHAVQRATEGKATLFKLGGDEFGLVINEKDPAKFQEILNRVMTEAYGKEVHKTFRDEKIVQAKKFKKGEISEAELKDFAPYSKEGISQGATRVGEGEDLEKVLERVEAQAKEMKIATKEQMNIDASKYGGPGSDPKGRPNQNYVPKPLAVLNGENAVTSSKRLPALAAGMTEIQMTKTRDLFRAGDVSVVEYKNDLGQTILRSERRYATSADGQRTPVSREVLMHRITNFIDGSSQQGKSLLGIFTTQKTPQVQRKMIWINTENLGKVNYFAKGSKAGDDYLKAVSDVIRRETTDTDVTFKLPGSEFAVIVQNKSSREIQQIQDRIRRALMKDSAVQKVFRDQIRHVEQEIKKATTTEEKNRLRKTLEELKEVKPDFSFDVPQFSDTGSVQDVLQATRDRARDLRNSPKPGK